MLKYFLIGAGGLLALLFAARTKAQSSANETKNESFIDLFDVKNLIDAPLELPLMNSPKTIAVENNNPLNIRETSDNWQGLASPRARKGFFNFAKPEYGFRAAKIIILNSYAKRGINTIAQIIKTWAPPFENDTPGYIKYVANRMKVPDSTKITSANIVPFLAAMARMESGKEWPTSTIETGVIMP